MTGTQLSILLVSLCASTLLAEREIGRYADHDEPRIIYAQPARRNTFVEGHEPFRGNRPQAYGTSDLHLWMEDNNIASVRAAKEGFILIPEAGRWALPQDAVSVWRHLDKNNRNQAHQKTIADTQLKYVSCHELEGEGQQVCSGAKKAYARKSCSYLRDREYDSCKAFETIFSGKTCDTVGSVLTGFATEHCIGIRAAILGNDCKDTTQAEAREVCKGVTRAMKNEECGKFAGITWTGRQSEIAYCKAMKAIGINDYIAAIKN